MTLNELRRRTLKLSDLLKLKTQRYYYYTCAVQITMSCMHTKMCTCTHMYTCTTSSCVHVWYTCNRLHKDDHIWVLKEILYIYGPIYCIYYMTHIYYFKFYIFLKIIFIEYSIILENNNVIIVYFCFLFAIVECSRFA